MASIVEDDENEFEQFFLCSSTDDDMHKILKVLCYYGIQLHEEYVRWITINFGVPLLLWIHFLFFVLLIWRIMYIWKHKKYLLM